MSKLDFDRFFDQLESLTSTSFVGFGPVFREFRYENNNYPPHNIVKVSDKEFYLELAVAGFKKNEITMEEHHGLLTVKGTKDAVDPEDLSYQYRGIATRSFSKSFRIAEYFEVDNAKLQDGILTVHFIKNVPEEAKPKLISIK